MADQILNLVLAPQFVVNITHDMGGNTNSGFTIVAGIASTSLSGGGEEYTQAEKDKLAAIEAEAKDDLTGAEIKTLYENEADTNAFNDAAVSKLAGIETAATADQTDAQIRTAVEAATDSNVFTDADHSKLNAIEAGATADQTNSQIKTAYEANADTNVFNDLAEAKLGDIEADATADQTNGEIETAYNAQVAKISAGEITAGTEATVRRVSPADLKAIVLAHETGGGGMSDAEVKTAYENNANTNEFDDTEQSKLAGIEDSADVTDATNVGAAGAVMDGDITAGEGFLRKTGAGAYVAMKSNLGAATNPVVTSDTAAGYVVGSRWINTTLDTEYVCLDATNGAAVWTETTGAGGGGMSDAEVKTAYENNANTNAFTDAEKTSLGTMEDNSTGDQSNAEIRTAVAAATDSNVFTDAQQTSLGTMEDNATADQTDAEIRTAVEAATDSNVFTDADHTKLNTVDETATPDQTDGEIETAYNSQVAKVSAGEITAGTEALVRRLSPADVKAFVLAHETASADFVPLAPTRTTITLTGSSVSTAIPDGVTWFRFHGSIVTISDTTKGINAILEHGAAVEQLWSGSEEVVAAALIFNTINATNLFAVSANDGGGATRSILGTVYAPRDSNKPTITDGHGTAHGQPSNHRRYLVADTAEDNDTLVFNISVGTFTGTVTVEWFYDGGAMTDAAIRTAVEAATDSNVFTDVDHTKLNGIVEAYDLGMDFLGKPTDAQVIARWVILRETTMPADFAGAGGDIITNPTGALVIDIKDDGTTIGTISIATDGVFTFTTESGTEKVVAAGSVVTAIGPGTADATGEDIVFTLPGVL